MATLITQDDGSVLWDYDLPPEPTKKPAKKSASAAKPKENS